MPNSAEESAKDFFSNYSDYNKTLRTWFVTFGLGGPGLFLVNPSLIDVLTDTGNLRRVVYAFLVGCALQIFVALINKIAAWHEYDAKRKAHDFGGRWKKVSDAFWIDITCDIGSVVCFAYAVWLVMGSFHI